MATSKRLRFRTPSGVAQYPWLNEADTQFNEEGIYKTNLIIGAADAKEMVDEMKAYAKEQLGDKLKRARFPYKTDEETGDIIFTVKSKMKPKFYDTAGTYIPDNNVPRIFGGSVLRLKGSYAAYDKGANVGVSMQLNQVQIIEVSQGRDDGFDAVEGSFVFDKKDTAPETFDEETNEDYNF